MFLCISLLITCPHFLVEFLLYHLIRELFLQLDFFVYHVVRAI